MVQAADKCAIEMILRYLDGDLEGPTCAAFEEHVRVCKSCDQELRAQRLFLCELEASLITEVGPSVPENFGRVIAANAQSDMRGIRDRLEHKRALRFCVVLTLVAFALMGITASRALILTAQTMATKILGIFSLLWKTLYDAMVGLTIIGRVLTRGLLPESNLAGSFELLLLFVAVGLLSLLISSYHRTRLVE